MKRLLQATAKVKKLEKIEQQVIVTVKKVKATKRRDRMLLKK